MKERMIDMRKNLRCFALLKFRAYQTHGQVWTKGMPEHTNLYSNRKLDNV